MTSQQC
jgi:hypothetical protein